MKETMQKVMEKMMSGMMKPEDMPHMMETMMDSVFKEMTPEDRMNFMQNMMKKMMGGGDGGGPMKMCKDMTSSIKKTASLAAFATPELHALFSEWLGGKEKDVLGILAKSGKHDLAGIAKALKLTSESTAYLLARMAADEKLTLEVKSTGSATKPAAKKKAKRAAKTAAKKKVSSKKKAVSKKRSARRAGQ